MTCLRLRLPAFGLATVLGCTGYTYAACGQGKVPTYNDISGLRYVRTDCFGKCPSYEVLISNLPGLDYVGRRYVDMLGTYEAPLGHTLTSAQVVLERHHFYGLNYDDTKHITDVPHYIVAVARCGVTTKLDWPDFGDRPDIESLFNALDALVKNVKWHKTSDSTESPEDLFASIP
jgi:hypothetical protein